MDLSNEILTFSYKIKFPSLLLQIHSTFVCKCNQNLQFGSQVKLTKSPLKKLKSLRQASCMVSDNFYG